MSDFAKDTNVPANDSISRKAVLDLIDGWTYDLCNNEDAWKATEEIENLPSAQERKKRWIPCSERSPEDLEEVNVTWVNHIPEPYYDFLKDNPFSGSAVYYKGEWFWYSTRCVDILAEYGTNGMDKVDDGIEITAWMPLPEPYKGEEG